MKKALERGDSTKEIARLEKKGFNLRRVFGLAKVAPLSEIISDRLADEPDLKVVLAFYHTDVGRAYMSALKRWHPLFYDGGTPPAKKPQIVKTFQTVKKHRIIVGQLQAIGVGQDCSAARSLIFAEWSHIGVENEQMMARVFNMNALDPCFVEFAVLPGSLDLAIAANAQAKLATAEKIFG